MGSGPPRSMPRVYGRIPFTGISKHATGQAAFAHENVCPFPESVVEYGVVRSCKRGTLSANGLRFTSPTDGTLVIYGLYLDTLSPDNASSLRDGEGWLDRQVCQGDYLVNGFSGITALSTRSRWTTTLRSLAASVAKASYGIWIRW